MSALKNKHFHDEASAFAWVESVVWPEGKPVCPHCGEIGSAGRVVGKAKVREDGTKTRPARQGLWKCYSCRKQFTVRVGTIFEDSKVALHLWLQAICLIAASKKGMSANQLGRTLGVTLKTAWFMGHRIRLAMADLTDSGLMGEGGKVVEVDETYFGRKPGRKVKAGAGHKEMVFALVERGGGVRAFHIAEDQFSNIKSLMAKHMTPEAVLNTDEHKMYKGIGKCFADHQTVNHSQGEYVRDDATTNHVEGFFQVFKRGMKGTYQHCSSNHLHRYVAEFEFRFNNRVALGIADGQRADNILRGIVGKRLTYRTAD